MHTPSTPTVNAPASATDPRYSTSGILNAQIKEKNRQGLLSTYGGRTGSTMNINKFADAKNYMRDPSAMPQLEALSRLYADAAAKAGAKGVAGRTTHSRTKATDAIDAYNQSVDSVNNYLKSYGVNDSGLNKAQGAHNVDKRIGHDDDFRAKNRGEIQAGVASAGQSGDIFNKVADAAKKQKKAA